MFKILEDNKRITISESRDLYDGKMYILRGLEGLNGDSYGTVHAICDEAGHKELIAEYSRVNKIEHEKCMLCGSFGEGVLLNVQWRTEKG